MFAAHLSDHRRLQIFTCSLMCPSHVLRHSEVGKRSVRSVIRGKKSSRSRQVGGCGGKVTSVKRRMHRPGSSLMRADEEGKE